MSLTDGLGGSSEETLLERARMGDGSSFGVLYERHLGAARRVARSLVADRSDADDVVAEVFAATFVAMRRGLGPAEDFRSYLLRSVRRECHRTWRRGTRQRPGGDVVVDLAAARSTGRDDFDWFDEGEVVHRAFAALSPRLRHVLWLTEIDGLSHEDVASRLGTTAVNVAQLARRARLELGQHYLEAHLPTPDGPVPTECTRPRQVLAEVVRGTAGRRAERLAADHMATCPACTDASAELQIVNARLRTGHVMALLPALDASRPVTAGLVAKLMAWIGGPVSTMTAAATLALVTAVAPQPTQPIPDAAPTPAATAIDPERTVTPALPIPPAVPGPRAVAATSGVEPPVNSADPGPLLSTVLGAVSGSAASGGATTPAAPAVTADAAARVLDALPPIAVEDGLGPLLPVGPVAAPPVDLDVTVGEGGIESDVVVGNGGVEAEVPGGVRLDVGVPPATDVVDAQPVPQVPALPILPILPPD